MASQSKTKTVKFEVGQLVKFSGNRVGQVSRIAKNGAIYVSVLGETTGADQTREELRVKKADLQLIEEIEEPAAQQEIELSELSELAEFAEVSEACAKLAAFAEKSELAEFAETCAKLAETCGALAELSEAPQEIEESEAQQASVEVEPTVLPDAVHALRELMFSVTRHSILTAFIDVALNKHIPGYHHQVAGNLKNLMAAAFDPVHDPMGYARINTWTMAALGLLVKNKERVAKMLNQPIEAAPIKIDRVTKLGMWLDKNMNSKGATGNDLTAGYDSCYMYDAVEKKLDACTFVVVEVMRDPGSNTVKILPIACAPVCYPEYLTAQSAIHMRQRFIRYYRNIEPNLHSYCGIVPVLKTGLAMQAAIDDTMASVIDSLKGIK